MDGAEGITKCGIPPQSSFGYIFQAVHTATIHTVKVREQKDYLGTYYQKEFRSNRKS